MATRDKDNRRRCRKVHIWVHPAVFDSFERLRLRLGFSRDGGFEHAMTEYVETHRGDTDALSGLAHHRG